MKNPTITFDGRAQWLGGYLVLPPEDDTTQVARMSPFHHASSHVLTLPSAEPYDRTMGWAAKLLVGRKDGDEGNLIHAIAAAIEDRFLPPIAAVVELFLCVRQGA